MALADLLVPSFVEVGKIKIGTLGEARTSKSGSTWRPPVKLDHFIITTLYRNDQGMLIQDAELMEALKEFRDADKKLRSIPVMFGSNDLEEIMQTAYVWYVGKQLAGRADGREAVFNNDPETGKVLPEPKVYKWHPSWLERFDPCWYPNDPSKRKSLFKLFTSVNVMVASPAARWGGFYRFRTTSEISARQLYGSLLHLRKLTGGVLRGLVFRMVVRPMVVTPNGQTTTVHVVHVEYVNSDLKQLQGAAREQAAFELANVTAVVETERQYKMLVAAGKDEEPDEDLVVVEEEDKAELPPKQPTVADKQVAALAEIEKTLKAAPDKKAFLDFWNGPRLKELWAILDDAQQQVAIAIKDTCKAELAKPKEPAKTPPPHDEAEPPAADETPLESQGPPTEEIKEDEPPKEQKKPPATAGANIVKEIERLSAAAGGWAHVRETLGKEIGFTGSRVKDLTAEEALGLLERLKKETVPA